MSELKLVTRNIRINGIQHKVSDMSEEESDQTESR